MKRRKTKCVFDASAILALYYNESGKKQVRLLLDKSESLISAVNLCEVFSKLLEDGLDSEQIWESFFALEIQVVDFHADVALAAAHLRPATRRLGLSLGDRACLALAIQQEAVAVTADKSWAKLNICKIEVIR